MRTALVPKNTNKFRCFVVQLSSSSSTIQIFKKIHEHGVNNISNTSKLINTYLIEFFRQIYCRKSIARWTGNGTRDLSNMLICNATERYLPLFVVESFIARYLRSVALLTIVIMIALLPNRTDAK